MRLVTDQIDGPYIPPAPERAPGGGRDMPKKDWQHDAWLPADPVDKEWHKLDHAELLALADRLEQHTTSLTHDAGEGRYYTYAAKDPDCQAAAKWLRYFAGRMG